MADVANALQVKLAVEHARLESERSAQRSGSRKCCRCNGNGTCIRCDCATSQRRCSDCLPLKKHRCMNSSFPQDSSKQQALPGSHPLSSSAGVPPGSKDSDVSSNSVAVRESIKVYIKYPFYFCFIRTAVFRFNRRPRDFNRGSL